jgi:hypothetical protein
VSLSQHARLDTSRTDELRDMRSSRSNVRLFFMLLLTVSPSFFASSSMACSSCLIVSDCYCEQRIWSHIHSKPRPRLHDCLPLFVRPDPSCRLNATSRAKKRLHAPQNRSHHYIRSGMWTFDSQLAKRVYADVR